MTLKGFLFLFLKHCVCYEAPFAFFPLKNGIVQCFAIKQAMASLEGNF